MYYKDAFDRYRQNNPQFKTMTSQLYFTGNKTLYVPAHEAPSTGFFADLPMVSQNNIVYTDLNADTQVAQKKIFDQTFLLKDVIQNIKWKITDEVRDIAGFSCRRANGLILDSIYIVAFYCTEILVPGGPESFAGLPGMILQLSLPHENITWKATRLRNLVASETPVIPPSSGKPVARNELYQFLLEASRNWGDRKGTNMKSFLF